MVVFMYKGLTTLKWFIFIYLLLLIKKIYFSIFAYLCIIFYKVVH